ncbi:MULTISPECIES: exodeoxyribonuclease VII small subunit [Chitinophagaceae]
MSTKISYTEAFQELQTIVTEMENGDIDLDNLSEKVKRASFLIGVCKEKLSSTEENVQNILLELNSKPETE